jgi:glycosyltransferase involved in cell wall biosynthesis
LKLFLLIDPAEGLHGPLRPPFLLAKELKGRFEIIFVSPFVSEIVDETLRSEGIELLSLNKRYLFHGSLLTFEAWLRRCTFKAEDGIVINFSQCFLADAHVYYAQGPITKALDDMYPELKASYKLAYKVVRPLLVRRDKKFNEELRKRSRIFIANSRFCASMYEDWGIKVDDVVHPPLDCEQFKPTTSRPSSDYALAYVGKETKYSLLRRVAGLGVRIKAFGSKAPYVPKQSLKHPNIELLGRVSDEELMDLYSNALFTLFAFTHEPFGYVPVESMACGTPVLTYNRQGPRESVVDGVTGWLADSDEELVNLALKIWRKGYPSWMRSRCRERALEFYVKVIAGKWLEVLRSVEGV